MGTKLIQEMMFIHEQKRHSHEIKQSLEFLMADFLIKYNQGEASTDDAPNKVIDTMRRVTTSLLMKHEVLYTELVAKYVESENGNIDNICIKDVAAEVFNDGVISWGRIASLYTFACKVGRYCKAKNVCTDRLALELAEFTSSELGCWIRQNGDWNAFVDKFSNDNIDAKIKKGLMWTLAGLGLCLIVTYARHGS